MNVDNRHIHIRLNKRQRQKILQRRKARMKRRMIKRSTNPNKINTSVITCPQSVKPKQPSNPLTNIPSPQSMGLCTTDKSTPNDNVIHNDNDKATSNVKAKPKPKPRSRHRSKPRSRSIVKSIVKSTVKPAVRSTVKHRSRFKLVHRPIDSSKLNVKILLFERNEIDILQQWIEHHAKIVGYQNLIIFDHKSNDGSFDLLKTYQSKGVTINRYRGEYTNKGKVLSVEMLKYGNTQDLLIPLDADEFIVTHRNGKITRDEKAIRDDLRYLKGIKGAGRIVFGKIYNFVNTVLVPKLWDMKHFECVDYADQETFTTLPKSFFVSKNFINTDMGNHYGKIHSDSSQIVANNLSLLHFQMRGLQHFVNKTEKSVYAFGYHTNKPVLNMGRHWKNDYDILRNRGSRQAFSEKYLVTDPDRINKLIKYNMFVPPPPNPPKPQPPSKPVN